MVHKRIYFIITAISDTYVPLLSQPPLPERKKMIFLFFWGEVAVTHADSLTSLVSLIAVPVNASTGTEGDELICKDTSICKCKVSSILVV